MTNAPRPLGLDRLADMLTSAQHFTFTDHGATRFYSGQCSAGAPFQIMVNNADGQGFLLSPVPRLRLVAANESA